MDDYMQYKMATENTDSTPPGCPGPGCSGCLPWLLAAALVLSIFSNCG